MDGVRIAAPAKINWTLEVLRIRPDGYHEIRSVMQTIDLYDVLTITPSHGIELSYAGDPGVLHGIPVEEDLAYRAAVAYFDRTSVAGSVHIELEKAIPVAAGLGGGSSDAAAVLRGLNVLNSSRLNEGDLIALASTIGSDVPFFTVGGTAAVAGRGEIVEALADAVAPPLLLCTPPPGERANKTGAMFSALDAAHFSDGYVTIGVRETVDAGRTITAASLSNVFERVTGRMQPETELALSALRDQGFEPRLCGAGPSFYLLLDDAGATMSLIDRVRELEFEPRIVNALPRGDAVLFEEL